MILPNKYLPYIKSNVFVMDKIVKVLLLNNQKKLKIEKLWVEFSKNNEWVPFKQYYLCFMLLVYWKILAITELDWVDWVEVIIKEYRN